MNDIETKNILPNLSILKLYFLFVQNMQPFLQFLHLLLQFALVFSCSPHLFHRSSKFGHHLLARIARVIV